MKCYQKILTICFLIFVFLGLCIGCSSPSDTVPEITTSVLFVKHDPPTVETPYYDLEAINGEAYLTMKRDNTSDLDGDGTMGGLVASPSLKFSSATEMREKLLNGRLTESELRMLGEFTKDEFTGKIKLCNLNRLYEPIMGHGKVNSVILEGEMYYFYITLPSGYSGFSEIFFEDRYEAFMEKKLNLVYKNENLTITEEKQIEDRNAKEISFYTKSSTGKMVIYTRTGAYGEYTVIEEYLLSHTAFPSDADQEKPVSITVYLSTENGVNGVIEVAYGDERPSLEELTSFGFKALTPTMDVRVTD